MNGIKTGRGWVGRGNEGRTTPVLIFPGEDFRSIPIAIRVNAFSIRLYKMSVFVLNLSFAVMF